MGEAFLYGQKGGGGAAAGIKIENGKFTYNGLPVKAFSNYKNTFSYQQGTTTSDMLNHLFFVTDDIFCIVTPNGFYEYKITDANRTISVELLYSGEAGYWDISADKKYVLHCSTTAAKNAYVYPISSNGINISGCKTYVLANSFTHFDLSADHNYLVATTKASKSYVYKYDSANDSYTSLYYIKSSSSYTTANFFKFKVGSNNHGVLCYKSGSNYRLRTFNLSDTVETSVYYNGSQSFSDINTYYKTFINQDMFIGDPSRTQAHLSAEALNKGYNIITSRAYNNLNDNVLSVNNENLGTVVNSNNQPLFYFAYNTDLSVAGNTNNQIYDDKVFKFTNKYIVRYLPSASYSTDIERAAIHIYKLVQIDKDYIFQMQNKDQNYTVNGNDMEGYFNTNVSLLVPDTQSTSYFPASSTDENFWFKFYNFKNAMGSFSISGSLTYGDAGTTYNGIAIFVNGELVYTTANTGEPASFSTTINSNIGDFVEIAIRDYAATSGVAHETKLKNCKIIFDDYYLHMFQVLTY